jgi:alkylation response protein AidB-like acyl-CoA dehydrogenase
MGRTAVGRAPTPTGRWRTGRRREAYGDHGAGEPTGAASPVVDVVSDERFAVPDFSLDLNADQLQIQAWVHDFANDVVRPVAHDWDEREETPWPVIEQAARIGLYSFDFVANCFADPTGLQMALVMEEMAWGDAGIGLAIFGSTLAVAGIMANGTPEQQAEWIPQCFGTPDDIKIAAFGVSEPDAGSDVSSLSTRAVYDQTSDEWVLNGVKTWITNGGLADLHVLVASVDPELGSRGQASFVVPEGTEGLRQGQKFKKMGIRASHTAEVVLSDCRVPNRCLLGGKERLDERLARAREGRRTSSQAAMATFEASRPLVGAQAVGIARAAYEFALDYAKQRRQFGRAIIENQAIAFKLADMKTAIDAARLLVWRAAWMARNQRPFEAGEGSMSKVFAGETAVRVTEEAIQILGGYGYVRDNPVERWHRDSKIYTIFEGTSEIQRLVIARAISGVHVV